MKIVRGHSQVELRIQSGGALVGACEAFNFGTGLTTSIDDEGVAQVSASGGPSGEAFPVGSVFISVVATDPATLLGYGTWAAFGSGKVLVGLDPGDTDFDVVEETGGSKTVTPTGTVSTPIFTGQSVQSSSVSAGTPTGTIAWPVGVPAFAGTQGTVPAETISWPAGVPTFVGNALATHLHGVGTIATSAHAGTAVGNHSTLTHSTAADSTTSGGTAKVVATTHTISAHSVTQPSAHTLSGSTAAITAGTPTGTISWPAGVPTNSTVNFTPAGTITWPAGVPTFSGIALGSHDHAVTAAGTVSQPTFTGVEHSIVQPYVVVYMWKRTA